MLAWATLAHKALPQQAVAALLRAFGDPETVLGASRATLAGVVSPAAVRRLQDDASLQTLEATLRWLDDEQHHLIAWDDADYPHALLELGDAPPVLFFIGRRELLNRPGLAIVGSRNATAQGVETAREFAAALAAAGLTIISGLALGIDAAAHEGGLLGAGSTLAWLYRARTINRRGGPTHRRPHCRRRDCVLASTTAGRRRPARRSRQVAPAG